LSDERAEPRPGPPKEPQTEPHVSQYLPAGCRPNQERKKIKKSNVNVIRLYEVKPLKRCITVERMILRRQTLVKFVETELRSHEVNH